MRYCRRCVLPEGFPGADLDATGVCAYCRREAASEAGRERRQETLRGRFRALCDEDRGSRPYDCLMAWSGGKDSSYTLALLRREYGLRVLAYTFDNGFVAPQAIENMRQVADRLGVDHVTVRPRFDLLRTVFAGTVQRDVYGAKALTRASAICNACMGLAKGIGLQLALWHRVPMIVYGWSPGQAPLSSALFRRPLGLYRRMVDALVEPLARLAGDEVRAYFPSAADWEGCGDPPHDVAPLLFHPYDEDSILSSVADLGWRRPADTDPNSSNCLLNAFGNAVHRARHGFHPYALELANLVRLGSLPREEALTRLEAAEDANLVAMVCDRLGVAPSTIAGDVALPGPAEPCDRRETVS